jgi:hypothetical protein
VRGELEAACALGLADAVRRAEEALAVDLSELEELEVLRVELAAQRPLVRVEVVKALLLPELLLLAQEVEELAPLLDR